jgi:hypothetical protein
MKALFTCLALISFGVCTAELQASPAAIPVSSNAKALKRGKVFLTVDEALALAFGDAEIERGTVYLTKKQEQQAAKLSSVDIHSSIVHPYVAHDDKGRVIGTAYFDTHRVRTLDETLLVVVGPEGEVKRIEMLSFSEPPEYIPRGVWYAQFIGKKLDSELNLKRKIRGVTGATLTARATTKAVRRVLALHEVLAENPIVRPPGAQAQASR